MRVKRGLFLGEIKAGWSVRKACDTSGIERSTIRRWLKEDDAFKADYDVAYETGTEVAEDELFTRATREDKPSDLCLFAVLRARKPEKYRENFRAPETEVKHVVSFSDRFAPFLEGVVRARQIQIEQQRKAMLESGETGMIDITPGKAI